MLKEDLLNLTDSEQRALRDAFHEGTSPRRVRGVLLSALVVVVGVTLFLIYGVSNVFLAGLTVVTVAVATLEKLTYQRWMLRYESVIRKLSNRVEHLEGVPKTSPVPEDSPPSVRVTERYAAANDGAGLHRAEHTRSTRQPT